ncbi:hypothetical protein DFH09DRAFT_1211561 [Mycena vulgaris]|nr:hypothetical protein DFH09DRAFT_1211561 [Mycena vulgaris]
MPFSVKATYGRSGELRKLTFDSFPSYEQLYNQLYRVFPISHTYYLSKLLFSPDSSKATILIGREVHNADQYNSCTAPYANGAWPNAMLRFTVFDETPHKLPAGFVADNTSPATLTGGGAPSAFFASAAHIPPPPIILSSASSSQAQMDVDSSSTDRFSTSTFKPQHQHDPQSVTPAACCAVSQGKVEMEGIVSRFKDDLDRILKSSFATAAPAPPSFHMPPLPPSSFCLFKYCTTCAKIFQGPWFACETCSIVVCLGCHENQNTNNSFCVASMAPHQMKKEVCAACPAEDAPRMMNISAPLSWSSLPVPLSAQWSAPPTQWATPAQQGYSPAYPFGGPPPITPFIPAEALPRAPAPASLPPLPIPAVAQVPEAPAPPAPPLIHRGVRCDMCDNCHYDLCTPCIASGSAERHNPFHEFLEIKEPGRVIVHTVYSGDGERDAPSSTSARVAPPPPQAEQQPAPQSITREQHPHHAFVKLANASDYIRRENPSAEMHFVTCNGCSKTVFGVRYKCMHPECPDFDLCECCEAFPIPMHPANHPLLKMRSANTVVPTVYRVGQTTLIEREEMDLQRGRRSRSSVVWAGRSNTMPASFFDSAPTPLPPPSPFFFRSESSRSSSPVLAPLSPRYAPGPPSPRYQPLSPRYAPNPRAPVAHDDAGGPVRLSRHSHTSRSPHSFPWRTPTPPRQRFSHSPSPSPPLFRTPSRSVSPPQPWPDREFSRWQYEDMMLRGRQEALEREADEQARDLAGHDGAETEIEKEVEEPVVKKEEPVVVKKEEPAPAPLRASFVNDVTLPEGQIFPPGAEFMKCWQMVNSGGVEWPASTELVYVAGERLAREHGGPAGVPVGVVKIGAEVELWTGELKAPETPGRYGNLFGDSIWIDIIVMETRSNESSLSSSSIIVMPRGAQSVPTSSASGAQAASHVSHGEVEEDELSEHGSDASSVSLISVPTSEDEEWASVPSVEEPQAQRYVVLYDDASSQSSDEE